jgi:hypothetical protein
VIRAVTLAAVASVLLVGAYLVIGGASYAPTEPPDPCHVKAPDADGVNGTVQRVGLTALARSACELGVSRESLLLALAGERDLGISEERRNEAFRDGIGKALDEEQDAGNIGGAEAFLLRGALVVLPMDAILDRLFAGG